jgi:hypothetical protein
MVVSEPWNPCCLGKKGREEILTQINDLYPRSVANHGTRNSGKRGELVGSDFGMCATVRMCRNYRSARGLELGSVVLERHT